MEKLSEKTPEERQTEKKKTSFLFVIRKNLQLYIVCHNHSFYNTAPQSDAIADCINLIPNTNSPHSPGK